MIRRLRVADIPVVLNLWFQNTKQAHPYIPASHWENNIDLVRQMLANLAETYVFVDKHKIKGFISLLPGDFVGALFVNENCRSCRIGTKLLRYVLRHRTSASLNVYAANRSAIAFYHRGGFKIVREQTDGQTGQPELLMSWAKGCKSTIHRRPGES